MALVIRPHHRRTFSGVLEKIFRIRRSTFVERLGWPMLGDDGLRERDEFDAGNCLYLATLNERGEVLATMRMTCSTEPNVTCDALQRHFKKRFPRETYIAEGSRFCVDERLEKPERRAAALNIESAACELAAREGWTHGIGVANETMALRLMRNGMPVKIIDGPVFFPPGNEMSFAILGKPDEARGISAWQRADAIPNCLEDPDADSSLIRRYGDADQAA